MRPRHWAASLILFCLICSFAFAQEDEDAFEPVELPPEIAAKVRGLPQDKIDFLRGDGVFNFADRHDTR